ncbi:MAG: helix-turn-helix domain-containing protein [Gammaproteobacteria bacterium]
MSAKLVLLALAGAVDERGTCRISVGTLAAQCSVSPRTIQRLLHELEMKKRIERQRQHRTDGSSAPSRFRLPAEDFREMTPHRDNSVAGDRDGCQGAPDAGVRAGGLRNEPVVDWKRCGQKEWSFRSTSRAMLATEPRTPRPKRQRHQRPQGNRVSRSSRESLAETGIATQIIRCRGSHALARNRADRIRRNRDIAPGTFCTARDNKPCWCARRSNRRGPRHCATRVVTRAES